jgi:hypothetical protein
LPMPVLDFGRAKARSMNLDDGSCDCEYKSFQFRVARARCA